MPKLHTFTFLQLLTSITGELWTQSSTGREAIQWHQSIKSHSLIYNMNISSLRTITLEIQGIIFFKCLNICGTGRGSQDFFSFSCWHLFKLSYWYVCACVCVCVGACVSASTHTHACVLELSASLSRFFMTMIPSSCFLVQFIMG